MRVRQPSRERSQRNRLPLCLRAAPQPTLLFQQLSASMLLSSSLACSLPHRQVLFLKCLVNSQVVSQSWTLLLKYRL